MENTVSNDLIQVIAQSKDVQTVSDPDRLKEEAVAYHGQLKKHKSDAERIYLLLDPLSPGSILVEFKVIDIIFAENISNLTGPKGKSVPIARIWVKKDAVGLRLTPFLVSDFTAFFQEHLE